MPLVQNRVCSTICESIIMRMRSSGKENMKEKLIKWFKEAFEFAFPIFLTMLFTASCLLIDILFEKGEAENGSPLIFQVFIPYLVCLFARFVIWSGEYPEDKKIQEVPTCFLVGGISAIIILGIHRVCPILLIIWMIGIYISPVSVIRGHAWKDFKEQLCRKIVFLIKMFATLVVQVFIFTFRYKSLAKGTVYTLGVLAVVIFITGIISKVIEIIKKKRAERANDSTDKS